MATCRQAVRCAGAALVALGIGLGTGVAAPLSAAAAPAQPACSTALVPTGDLEIAGTLCLPPGPTPATVMVLVPGATYTRAYWDVAVEPDVHDFRLAMNRGGYATFVMDRLGSGSSSKPPSVTVTIGRQSEAVHDVVGALRAGLPGMPRFPSVILGGHSLGSTIVITEASQHRDADAVLITGFSHAPNAVGLGELFATLVPAGADPGYLTTRPGTRGVFYGDGDVSPEIAAYDEATKDVVSAAEVPEAVGTTLPVPPGLPTLDALNLPTTAGIRAPVLLVDGGDDRQFCGPPLGSCHDDATFAAAERPFFPGAAAFESRIVPGSGHDLALSRTAPEFQRIVLDWARRTVPAAGR